MNAFINVWQILNDIDNSFGLVREDWRQRLGDEYEVLQSSLKANGKVASIYPCGYLNGNDNCQGMSILASDSNFTAYCSKGYFDGGGLLLDDDSEDFREKCKTKSLSEDDVALLSFDLCEFWRNVSINMADDNAGLFFQNPTIITDSIVYLGYYSVGAESNSPVFFSTNLGSSTLINDFEYIKCNYSMILNTLGYDIEHFSGSGNMNNKFESFALIFPSENLVYSPLLSQRNSDKLHTVFIPLNTFLKYSSKNLIFLDDFIDVFNGFNSPVKVKPELILQESNAGHTNSGNYTTANVIMRRENDYTITFAGQTVAIPNNRGFQRLLFLMKHPDQFFFSSDLVNIHIEGHVIHPVDMFKRKKPTSDNNDEDEELDDGDEELDDGDEDEGNTNNSADKLSIWERQVSRQGLHTLQPLIKDNIADDQAIHEIAKKYYSLIKEQIECDSKGEAMSKSKREEMRLLRKYLFEAKSSSGRKRSVKTKAHGDMKTLKTDINERLVSTMKDSHPLLYKHLKKFLIIGIYNAYVNNNEKWEFK